MNPSHEALLHPHRGLPLHPQDLFVAWITLILTASLQNPFLLWPRSRYWRLLCPMDLWVPMIGHRHLRRTHLHLHCASRPRAQKDNHHPKLFRYPYPLPLRLPILLDPLTKMVKSQVPLLQSHRISFPDLTPLQPSPAHFRPRIPRLLILPMSHPHPPRHLQLPGAAHLR